MSENGENVILKIMMGTDNVIYWHILQHTFKPQQQDVPSAYNMYISHVFYGVLNASLSLDFLYFLCKSVTSQINLILYCHHIKLCSVNSMVTKFDIWHPVLLSALTHSTCQAQPLLANKSYKLILFTFPITKAWWHGIIHPTKKIYLMWY
jgi:hypothetical protein